jgi:uncharacterized protein with FMN-binding domain
VAVLAWLVLCWFIGSSRAAIDLTPFLERAWPNAVVFPESGADAFRIEGSDGTVLGYATVGSASGYGGPLQMAVALTPRGDVHSIAVLRHRETPAFFARVLNARFLEELVDRRANEPMVPEDRVDGVSGATYTVLGMTQAVRRAAQQLANEHLALDPPPTGRRVVFGLPELVLILLFGLGVWHRRLRGRARKAVRWITLVAGLVLLGFVFNAPFVLAHVNMALMGYWPEWQTHLYWYLLIAGLLLFKAKREWNVYCYDFCPFGACQELLGAIGGAKPRRVRWPRVLLWAQRLVTLAAVSLALIYRNPGLTSFEIFGTAFRLEGSNFQFALLAMIVLSSLFLYRPWCRYLCPLHKNTMEGLFDNTRRIARTLWQRARPEKERA